tara:strand:+ start:4741 stop:5697 length:957 start_codon:yes stop_codon:yes gene_type:complete
MIDEIINNRDTAFYINGGIGRVVCAIPALEKYCKNNPQDDFIIFSEFAYEAFSGHPELHGRSYPVNAPHLFKDAVQHRNVIIPEPYAIWEYYNQKCNIAQAFDIIINGSLDKDLPNLSIHLSNEEKITANNIITDMKSKRGNKPMIVFQPFGKGITLGAIESPSGPVDSSGRSFTLETASKLIQKIEHRYAVLLMNEFNVDFQKLGTKDEVYYVDNVNLRKWFGLINAADSFIGCDSIGQHIAHTFSKPSTVVFGSTFPENVSYPQSKNFNVLDFYKDKRIYSPIRITVDEHSNRQNEKAMALTEAQIQKIASKILNH